VTAIASPARGASSGVRGALALAIAGAAIGVSSGARAAWLAAPRAPFAGGAAVVIDARVRGAGGDAACVARAVTELLRGRGFSVTTSPAAAGDATGTRGGAAATLTVTVDLDAGGAAAIAVARASNGDDRGGAGGAAAARAPLTRRLAAGPSPGEARCEAIADAVESTVLAALAEVAEAPAAPAAAPPIPPAAAAAPESRATFASPAATPRTQAPPAVTAASAAPPVAVASAARRPDAAFGARRVAWAVALALDPLAPDTIRSGVELDVGVTGRPRHRNWARIAYYFPVWIDTDQGPFRVQTLSLAPLGMSFASRGRTGWFEVISTFGLDLHRIERAPVPAASIERDVRWHPWPSITSEILFGRRLSAHVAVFASLRFTVSNFLLLYDGDRTVAPFRPILAVGALWL
jgi:hypothetical protein